MEHASGRGRGEVGSCHAARALSVGLLMVVTACEGPRAPEATGSAEVLAFGHPDSVLLWSAEEKRTGFPRYDEIFPTRAIPASRRPLALAADGSATTGPGGPSVTDPAVTGSLLADLDVAGFLERNHQAGVIVVHRGRVLAEAYADGHGPSTPWVSYSISKSVVSLLVGAAVRDGYIRSLDDPVTGYVPLLEGGAYEGVRVRDVLRMSSGVAWNEDYADPGSDVSREIDYGASERLRFLSDRPRVADPGTRFNYSTGEIFLAGAIVRGAVGNNLSAYLHQRIWEPFGMEADAHWMLVEPGGPEYAGCCISATLRDYARLGLFALADGVARDGTRVLPEGWIAESTEPSPANAGYGYLWWLHDDGSFSARGIFGQLIHIDPALDLVVAMHGLWPSPTSEELSAGRAAFLAEVKQALGAGGGGA